MTDQPIKRKPGRPAADPDNPKSPGRSAKVRNPGSGKSPSNAPARGPGWGGEAKGAGNGLPPKHLSGAGAGRGRMNPKTAEAQAAAEEMLAMQIEIARTTKFEQTRLDASSKVMDRIWGKPKQEVEASGKDGAPLFPSLAVNIAKPND